MSDHQFKHGDETHAVWLARAAGGYRLHAGSVSVAVDLQGLGTHATRLTVDGISEPVVLAVRGDLVHIHLDGAAYTLRYSDALTRLSSQGQAGGDDCVPAPMPGTVVAVNVTAGASVRRGETLLVIESMKLETAIAAPRDGVVKTVHVELGRSFERDAPLVTLEPATGSAP